MEGDGAWHRAVFVSWVVEARLGPGVVVEVRVPRPDGSTFECSLDPRADSPRLRPRAADGTYLASGFEIDLLRVTPGNSALLALVPDEERSFPPRLVPVPDEPGTTLELYLDPAHDSLRTYRSVQGAEGLHPERFDTPPSVLGELGRPLGLCCLGSPGPAVLTPEALRWGRGRYEIRPDILPGGGSGSGEGYVLFDHGKRTWQRLFAGTTGTVFQACGLLLEGRFLALRMDDDSPWPAVLVELLDDGCRLHRVPVDDITKLFQNAGADPYGYAGSPPSPRYALLAVCHPGGDTESLLFTLGARSRKGQPLQGTFLVRDGRLVEGSVGPVPLLLDLTCDGSWHGATYGSWTVEARLGQGPAVDIRVPRPDGSAFEYALDPHRDSPRFRPTAANGNYLDCGFEVVLLELTPGASARLALIPPVRRTCVERRVAVPDSPGETTELFVDPADDDVRAYRPLRVPPGLISRPGRFDTPPSVMGELGRALGICALGADGPGLVSADRLSWADGRFEVRCDILPGGGSGSGEGYVLLDHRKRTWLRLFADTTGTVFEACGLLLDGRLLALRMDSPSPWPDHVVELLEDGPRIHPVPMAAVTAVLSAAHVDVTGWGSQAPAPSYTLRSLEFEAGTRPSLRMVVDAIRLDGSPVRGTFLVREGRLVESSVDLLND